jgi:hypothetical protein
MKASQILRILEDQVGSLGSPTIKFLSPSKVIFRFNDGQIQSKVKMDLDIFLTAHVSPMTIIKGFDKKVKRPYSITVEWKPLSDPHSTQIKNDMLFLSTKYKMTKV